MIEKYRGGIVPETGEPTSLDRSGDEAITRYAAAMDALDLRGAAEAAWDLVGTANLYIQQSAPWTLAKAGRDDELNQVLGALARALYRLAVLTSPFIPGKAQLLWQAAGATGDASAVAWSSLANPPVAGRQTTKPTSLFPKLATV